MNFKKINKKYGLGGFHHVEFFHYGCLIHNFMIMDDNPDK